MAVLISMTKLTTSEIWDVAHNALASKSWAKAARALEQLAQRGATSDILADARSYGAPEHMVQHLQDLIDAVAL